MVLFMWEHWKPVPCRWERTMTQWLSAEAPEGNAHILPALKKIKWGLQVKLLTISENVGKLKKEREKRKTSVTI